MLNSTLKLLIDDSLCKNCGNCIEDCPNQTKVESTNHVDHNSAYCDKCFHCYALCPNHAIKMDNEFDSKILNNSNDLYEPFLLLLKKRRSVRQFTEDKVSKEDIKKLLESARFIPSGGNNHQMTITIIDDKTKIQTIKERILSYYQKTIKQLNLPLVPLFLRYFGEEKVKEASKDKDFVKKISHMIDRIVKGKDLIFYEAPMVILLHTKRSIPTAKEDCILAAYNIALTSEIIGLGSCFVSLSQQAMTVDSRTKQAAGLDKNDKVHAVLVIGHPKVKYKRAAFREEKEVVYA